MSPRRRSTAIAYPALTVVIASLAVGAVALSSRAQERRAGSARDSVAGDRAFRAMQHRGAHAMGVDQYTSTHHFIDRPDGGRIELVRDVDDTAGVERIRAHMRAIAASFAAGDFTTPAFVHAERVPGTRVMAERRAHVSYRYVAIPRGGALLITTRDSAAIRAVHEFLAFQRSAHHARDGA